MKLSIPERLALVQILPSEGDFTSIKIVRELRESLSFSEEEHELFDVEINYEEQKIEWDEEKAVEVDLEFGLKATSLIVETLEALEAEKKLEERHISLYEKFVVPTK